MPAIPNFSWTVNLGKGLRDALLALVPTVGAAIALAVFGAVSADNLATYGVPLWLMPILTAAFTSVRNFLRNKLGWPI